MDSSPRPLAVSKEGEGREMGMKERWKGKESQEAKRKEKSRERGKTWNNGVCVPYCLSALLATI